MTLRAFFSSFLLFGLSSFVAQGQRVSKKTTKIEVVQFPTVPVESAFRVALNLCAEETFFSLDDLRRYGGNMDLLKSSGERLSGMKYFTVGHEAEVVDVGPSLVVSVAIGPESQGVPTFKSEAIKGSEEQTFWANVPCRLPMRISLSSPDGEMWDAFEVDQPLLIRYGNEKVSTIERKPGSLSYSKGTLAFDSEKAVKKGLVSEEGSRFFRRKAVLLQLSRAIDALETRIFFLQGKVEVVVYSGKGKHDYPELDAARDVALESWSNGYFNGLSSPIATWEKWIEKVDFVDKKAKVTRAVALGLNLNLAQAHLHRNAFAKCAQAISNARALVLPGGEEFLFLEDLQDQLLKRRRALKVNGDFVLAPDVKRFKAPDFKNLIGKRSQNKDIQMMVPENRFDAVGTAIEQWESTEVAGSPEATAAVASEVSMAQMLGARLEQTIGGMMLRLNPITDPDLVGEDFPQEILDIPNLVYLDISGMLFGELPEALDRLVALQTLIVSRNGLSSLPESVGNLTGLKKLFVNGNELSDLPTSLVRCAQLKMLDIKDNRFSSEGVEQIQQMLGEEVKVKSN